MASALLTNIQENLNDNDTLNNRATNIITAAQKVLTEHLTPPPDDTNNDSLPKYFSERTKTAIKERDYAHNNSDATTLNLKAKIAKKYMRVDKIIWILK